MAENEVEVGVVDDFFAHVGVVALKVTADKLKIGDTLHFKGHTTDFSEQIKSMQIDHESVEEAKKGDDIGIKVSEKVRIHDKVFKVVAGD